MGARAFRPPPRRRPGKTLLWVELMSVDAALFDPVLGAAALAALACAETGCGGDRVADCAVCCFPWGPGRGPRRAMVVHASDRTHGERAHVGFVCDACAAGTEAEVWGRVRARMRADVPDLQEGFLSPVAGAAQKAVEEPRAVTAAPGLVTTCEKGLAVAADLPTRPRPVR